MGIRSWFGFEGKRNDPITFEQLLGQLSQVTYNGIPYGLGLNQTLAGGKEGEVAGDFRGYVEAAYKQNGIVFACMVTRQLLFAEARFQYRRVQSGRPGELFGTTDLKLLETPWPGATTGDLLSRALQDADLAGNFYAYRESATRLRRLRPDWVTIVIGSQRADASADDLDAEVLGYLYHPGGVYANKRPVALLREQVAHFAPIPDPCAHCRGMSWLTPVIREIQADSAATSHKLKFFENGATPNMVVKLDVQSPEKFKQWVGMFRDQHESVENAYKTLFLAAGSDATVVGADMRQIDFKVTQGHGETRIAAAARVPPIIVGLSEGLDAATYSNYGQARRAFGDHTLRPLWRNFAGSIAPLVNVPAGAELWYDDRDIPFLQEDQKDAAEVLNQHATAINTLVTAGFDPKTVVDAVLAGDLARLSHSGLVSVQLLEPGKGATPAPAMNGNGNGSPVPAQN